MGKIEHQSSGYPGVLHVPQGNQVATNRLWMLLGIRGKGPTKSIAIWLKGTWITGKEESGEWVPQHPLTDLTVLQNLYILAHG